MESRQSLKESVPHGNVSFPFAAYQWNSGRALDVTLHWHEEAEIVCLQGGEASVTVNMQLYHLKNPALIFIMPGEIHSIRLTENQQESALVFDMRMLSFENFDAVQYKIIHPLLKNQMQFPRIIQPEHPAWPNLFRAYQNAQQAAQKRSVSACLLVKSALYQMLACMYEGNCFVHESQLNRNDAEQVAVIKRVLTFLHQEYWRHITVEEAAKTAGLNPQYFCRYFKKMTGSTFTACLNSIRIENAKRHLLNTDESILNIAAACGYENIGYFIKRFRQEENMSPSAFRKAGEKS